MKNKHAFSRGFTLIELMIVIVILGILMGTILPRLTGAQARARDIARKADLTNIAQALESYFSDNSSYPEEPTGGCLNPTTDKSFADGTGKSTDSTTTALGKYLKGGSVPAAVSAKQDTLGCLGFYYYKPLKKGGVEGAAYVLASDVETWQLANYRAKTTPPGSSEFDSTLESSTYTVGLSTVVEDDDKNEPKSTIYVIIP